MLSMIVEFMKHPEFPLFGILLNSNKLNVYNIYRLENTVMLHHVTELGQAYSEIVYPNAQWSSYI